MQSLAGEKKNQMKVAKNLNGEMKTFVDSIPMEDARDAFSFSSLFSPDCAFSFLNILLSRPSIFPLRTVKQSCL